MNCCQSLNLVLFPWAASILLGCAPQQPDETTSPPVTPSTNHKPMSASFGEFEKQREQMLTRHLAGRDIHDSLVLKAMRSVPRHEFVPADLRDAAYFDRPLPIGSGQTISQPYIVALTTQLAKPRPNSRALDIGTGSGYQAAVLAEIVDQVFSIEIVEPLAEAARQRLKRLGYENIIVRQGDGYRGWPEEAPFDLIVVAAAPDHIPQPLIDQLAPGGRLVIPVGERDQRLMLVEKLADGSVESKSITPVAFVPMTGEAETVTENGRP